MTHKNGKHKVNRQISFSGILAKRQALGISKLKMADLIGIAENTYGRIENNTTLAIEKETLEKILSAFPDLKLEDVIVEVEVHRGR